jgi:hypothetical protein
VSVDDPRRPILRVLVGAPDVLTDHSEREQLDRARDPEQEHDRRVAGDRDGSGQPRRQDDERGSGAHREPEEAEPAECRDRQLGERKDVVGQVAPSAGESPRAAAPAPTWPAHVVDEPPPVPEPDELRDERTVALVQAEEGVADLPRAGEHVDAAGRDLGLNQTAIGEPEYGRGQPGRPGIVSSYSVAQSDVAFARLGLGEEALE